MFFFMVFCTFIGAWCGGFVGALGGLLFAAAVPWILAVYDSISS